MRPGVGTGDPDRGAFSFRNETVGADGELEGHGGTPFGDPEDVTEGEGSCFFGQNALLHRDTGIGKALDPAAGRAGIGIAKCDHGPRGLRLGNDLGASRAPSSRMSAGLKRDIEGRATRLRPARSSAMASACGRPPGAVQPRARISPVAPTTIAPTEGFGQVCPSPRRAS